MRSAAWCRSMPARPCAGGCLPRMARGRIVGRGKMGRQHMLMLALLAAAAAPGDGKIMMSDDWQAMTILEVGGESQPLYLRVKTGDLDGDGRADQAYLKLVCADGVLKQALYTRDSGSGMPT